MHRKYGIIIPVNRSFFFILSFNYLLSLHKWTPSTIRCEEDSIASHYGNNFEHCSSGPLHNGYCTMDKPWNNIFNHQRKRCLIFSDYICTSVVSEDTHGQSISNMFSFLGIFFIQAFLILGCWARTALPALLPSLEEGTLWSNVASIWWSLMLLISCYVCQTIETTFYNWWGNYELQEILCSLGFIQALFCCSLELIVSLYISNMRSEIMRTFFWCGISGSVLQLTPQFTWIHTGVWHKRISENLQPSCKVFCPHNLI